MILKCTNCSFELETPKNRIRCPQCKKHSLEVIALNVIEKEDVNNGFTTSMRNKGPKIKYDENGNQIGTFRRVEPIGRFKNKFKENNAFKEDTEKFDKKVKFTVSPRERKSEKTKKVYCANCDNEGRVPAICMDYYICPRCASRKMKT